MKCNTYYSRLVLILFCCCAARPGWSQSTGNPLVDALGLKMKLDTFSVAAADQKGAIAGRIVAFFNPYFPTGQVPADLAHLKTAVGDNAYLTSLLANVVLPVAAAGQNSNPSSFLVGSSSISLQSANLLGPSNVADVLATFIADRFKQELEIAYLTKFRDALKSDSTLQALLPNALVVLTQNDPFNYTVFFETLKEAIEKDIHVLPVNFGNFMARDPFSIGRTKPYYFPAVMLYQNVLRIVQGQNAFLVIGNLNKDPLLGHLSAEAGSFARLAAVLTRTLIDPSHTDGTTLITLTNIQKDLANADQQMAFLGFLLLKEKSELQNNIIFGGQNLYALLNAKAADVAALTQLIDWMKNLVTSFQGISEVVARITTQQGASKGISGQIISDMTNGIVHTLNVILDFPPAVVDLRAIIPNAVLAQAVDIVGKLAQISADVADSNYGLALSHVIVLLPEVVNISNTKTLALLQDYGNFAISIAKAKTNTDLENALSTAALPVGSYRIKRNSYKNIALNAWAGGFGGTQHYPGTLPDGVKRDNWLLGFTAPVGISYNWGQVYQSTTTKGKKGALKGYSNTVFLSIFDVGSITSFRLTHDTTATLPDFKWQNLLAPGVFYVLGFRNSPLSLGGGVQYGPQLRSITNNTAVILPSAVSVRLFLAVDIPMFNFFTRTQPLKEN
jgi:hypothetical protein